MSVIGCGYLGAVHAAAMASLGHDVVGIDVDEGKVADLTAGAAPFFEPGLAELLAEGVRSGRLRFAADPAAAAGAEVHFLAVGTPQSASGPAADLRFVDAAIDGLLPHLGPGAVVAGKSTVPVGTAARLARRIAETGATLAWNPEFLREGWAVHDTLRPDRLVVGAEDTRQGAAAVDLLRRVYAAAIDAGAPFLVTDLATAELVKGAANAFLATKISFINAMAEIAEAAGADVTLLAEALGHDSRIGRRYLGSGIGFGGGCLPKDIRALQARVSELGLDRTMRLLAEVDDINLRRRDRVVDLAVQVLSAARDGRVRRAEASGTAPTPASVQVLNGTRIAVLGVTFKPDSDDVRDSPALDVANRLYTAGADVRVYDPEGNANAAARFPRLDYVDSLDAAVDGAELTLLLTEWRQFREMDPDAVGARVASRLLIDGRNVLDVASWREHGWDVVGLGHRFDPERLLRPA